MTGVERSTQTFLGTCGSISFFGAGQKPFADAALTT
jgi:hypothetical protein